MCDAFIPPSEPVLARFVHIAECEWPVIYIRLNSINGYRSPLAIVGAAFNPDALMILFVKVNAYARVYGTRFTVSEYSGFRCSTLSDAPIMSKS